MIFNGLRTCGSSEGVQDFRYLKASEAYRRLEKAMYGNVSRPIPVEELRKARGIAAAYEARRVAVGDTIRRGVMNGKLSIYLSVVVRPPDQRGAGRTVGGDRYQVGPVDRSGHTHEGGERASGTASKRAIEIVRRAKVLAVDSDYVFPSPSSDKPLSNMVFLMALRRMGRDITAHGFRSAFRDWAAERTNFPREVCEMALAHTVSNKVEAAYRRGNLLARRKDLMESWAEFACRQSGKVVRLRQRKAIGGTG